MRGHRLGILAEVIATEFEFDNKRLTIYLKKDEEVSVCRLVRKLYSKFKTRIKVIEIQKPEDIYQNAVKYLKVSKLHVKLNKLLPSNNKEISSSSNLLTKYQQ